VTADPDGRIAETDERNNVLRVRLAALAKWPEPAHADGECALA
jgi:hypothetical protein